MNHNAMRRDPADPFTALEAGLVMRIKELEQREAVLVDALREYIDAADNSVNGEDGVAAMLRFGDIDKTARALIAKYQVPA